MSNQWKETQSSITEYIMRRGKLENTWTSRKMKWKKSRGRQREKKMDGMTQWQNRNWLIKLTKNTKQAHDYIVIAYHDEEDDKEEGGDERGKCNVVSLFFILFYIYMYS